MNELGRAIITGTTAFTASNIDDFVVLMFFFAQVNATFKIRHIIIGQYLGFTTLLIASLPGFFGSFIIPEYWLGLLGFVPIIIGISRLINLQKAQEEVQAVADVNIARRSILARLLNPQIFNVAAITIANGGDNIGIYLPLFASSDLTSLIVIVIVFFVLILVWCYIAYLLTRHHSIARVLTRYGHAIVPFILIGLGIYILIDNDTLQLLHKFQSN